MEEAVEESKGDEDGDVVQEAGVRSQSATKPQ